MYPEKKRTEIPDLRRAVIQCKTRKKKIYYDMLFRGYIFPDWLEKELFEAFEYNNLPEMTVSAMQAYLRHMKKYNTIAMLPFVTYKTPDGKMLNGVDGYRWERKHGRQRK